MEQKTQIKVEEDKQELFITRELDLPVELVFEAHCDPELISQWMGNQVISLENKRFGAYHFEVKDAHGNIILTSVGVIHDFVPNQKITRTFQMINTPFPVQLEFLEFEKLTDNTSKLNMQVIYKSVADRAAILKMPFAYGINMAHNRLEETMKNLK